LHCSPATMGEHALGSENVTDLGFIIALFGPVATQYKSM
jgi:hypothetical protein